MKQYKFLVVTMICILLAGLFGSVAVMMQDYSDHSDIVLLNDITQTAKENLGDLSKLEAIDFDARFVVFDAEENIVFSSADAEITCLGDAVRDHYPYMMITEDDVIIGSVVMISNPEENLKKQQRTGLLVIALSELCIVICIILWGIYIRKNVVKPFEKMERFAEGIAGGNLDIPLEMEKNNMFGIFTESFDIMREELAASREREIVLKQREKELIATLSHDLKTPITGIKLTAELMQAQTKEPANIEKLGNIYKKADQIDALVNDLFTSTMKDLGEMKVTISEECSGVLHEFVMRCDDKQLATETPIPECIISIDSRRMEQVIWNIISNSYKYADTPINITYEIVDNCLKMSIRDHGKGVPEDELMLLTNKFYRSSKVSDKKINGSGLGLYIAKMLMENMNGDIRCLNADPGFEVWLFIPLA